MAIADVNGTRLFYERTGSGRIPLVLVHGSWASHENWGPVVAGLAASFRVVTYDRRGHSDSARSDTQGSVREDAADLAGLIERLGLAPVVVVGNSFGSTIALRLAVDRPDLLQGLVAHEPPLFRLLAGDPATAPALEEAGRDLHAVVQRIASGDHAGAAEQFVETLALGPGSWAQLPPAAQQMMIGNAPTFADEMNEPEALDMDLDALGRFDRPVLLTTGEQSPPTFAPVIRKLAGALPRAEVVMLPRAGHIPHVTHPDLYVETMTGFVRKHAAV